MLATLKMSYFQVITTGTDNRHFDYYPRDTLIMTRVVMEMKGHQHWWLAGGYDLEMDIFRGC